MSVKLPHLVGLAFLLAVPFSASAQEVGEYGFLSLPVSAHAAALGGTAISVVEPEASLADQNPALLCRQMAHQVSLSYMNYVGDIQLASASYTGLFREHGTWQGGVRYVNYGDFDGYDESGNATGAFSAKDIALHAAVGYPINDRLRFGATLRGIYSKYEIESAFAIGVDAGLNYYNEAEGRSLSVVVSNLGGQLRSFDDHRVSLPTDLAVGMSKEVEHLPFCFTLTALNLLHWDRTFVDAEGGKHHLDTGETILCHLLFGAEWIASDRFFVAAGYNYQRQRQFSGMGGFLRGVSLGAGLNFDQWHLQAGYYSCNAAGGSLSLSLSYTLQ